VVAGALNALVALVKIVFGLVSGVTVIVADGLHSLGDVLVNAAGWFGSLRAAVSGKPSTDMVAKDMKRWQRYLWSFVIAGMGLASIEMAEATFYPDPVDVSWVVVSLWCLP